MQILLYSVFCIAQYEANDTITTDVIFKEKEKKKNNPKTLAASLATLWEVQFKDNA